MSEEKLSCFMLAGIFGLPPTQNLRQAVFMAPNRDMAITMFVSQCHAQLGETSLCMAISCDEIRSDVIAAAYRGTVGPAPVVSLVPTSPPETQVQAAGVDHRNDEGLIDGHTFWSRYDGRCLSCGAQRNEHTVIGEPVPDGTA